MTEIGIHIEIILFDDEYISTGTYDDNMTTLDVVSLDSPSSIIIGIITFISVIERTKEIGILRDIGASKHNISQVFNTETFIIGFCSLLLGIVISLLLLIPINSIIHSILGSDTYNFKYN